MKPNDKYVIGFTGGVGSGKSTILDAIAERYDVHVIKADEVGRRLMEKGRKIYNALVKAYGTGILTENGDIDRKKVADMVFGNQKELERINQIEHPIIRASVRQSIRQTKKTFVFLEAALVKEGGLPEFSREIMAITAKDSVRMKRLSDNRGYSPEKSKSIIKKQMTNTEYKAVSTVCFDNSGDLNDTLIRVFAYLDEKKVPKKGER